MRPQRIFKYQSVQRQSGVTTILAVLMMLSLFTFVAVVTDTGRLYLEKRSLQKNADLAAMETALIYCRDQTLDIESMTLSDLYVLSEQRNGFKGTDADTTVTITQARNAVTIALTHSVPTSLFAQLLSTGDNKTNLSAVATAKACEPAAQLTIRSNLVSLDGGLLGEILGTTLPLDAVNWQVLVNANINLLGYLIELGASSENYESTLNSNITLDKFFSSAADVLLETGTPSSIAAADVLNSLAAAAPSTSILIGDLIAVTDDTPAATLDTSINVSDLVRGGILAAAGTNGISLDHTATALGFTAATSSNVKIGVKILSPPIISDEGNPELDEIKVSTAQVQLFFSLTSSLSLGLGLIPQIDVLVTAAQADAHVSSATCTANGSKTLNSIANTSASSVQIGNMGANQANAFSGSPTINPITLLQTPAVVVLGTTLVPAISTNFKASMTVAANNNFPIQHLNTTDESLPELKVDLTDAAFKSTSGISDVLAVAAILDYTPKTITKEIALGPLTTAVGLSASALELKIGSQLSALLKTPINNALASLGVGLGAAKVGGALTCENDRVRLTN